MSLKNLLVTLSGAALLVGVPSGSATADPSESGVRGPACTVIVGGTGAYLHDELTARLAVDAPPCPHITYSLVVLDQQGGTEVARLTSSTFDEAGNILFSGTVPQADNEICIYVSSSAGRHVFDRAPNAGCVLVVDDAAGGAGGFSFR